MNKICSLSLPLVLAISLPALAQNSLPPAAASRQLESADKGAKRSLSEFVGRPFVLFVTGRNSSDAANTQQIELAQEPAARFARLSVADLKGIPFFVKGRAKKNIRVDHEKANAAISSALRARQKPVAAGQGFLTLLDFSGDIAKQLGVGGQTNKTYHAFVFAPSGAIALRLKQGEGGASEAATRAQIASALAKVSAP